MPRGLRDERAVAFLHALEHFGAAVADRHAALRADLDVALPFVAAVRDDAGARLRERLRRGLIAGEHVLAVPVGAVRDADELIVQPLHLGRDALPVRILEARVARLHDQLLDVLHRARRLAQRLELEVERRRRVHGVHAVLRIDRLRLLKTDGGRGGDRIVRRLDHAPAGRDLLLQLELLELRALHAAHSELVEHAGGDTHD
jgi:hypothetical protein